MSIDKDPEFYKLLISIIAFFAGILNMAMIGYLNFLKNNDKDIFERLNKIENEFSELRGEHKRNHRSK